MPALPPELAISLAWHQGLLPGPFVTRENRRVDVIHRGTWSHGLGPDFADAMLLFDGRDLRTGAVEIHRSARGWIDHQHHLDPRYRAVVLHLVLEDDGTEIRRADGALVPVVHIDADLLATLPTVDPLATDWSRFGGRVCAADLAVRDPAPLRAALFALGDRRLTARAARLEARLTGDPPGQTLWREFLDGLGFSANREPMRLLAAALPLATLESVVAPASPADRLDLARALLFGVAGFLPFAPTETDIAGLTPADRERVEDQWRRRGQTWRASILPPTAWSRARVRPANHPVARLAAAAAIVARAQPQGGLLAALLDPLRRGNDPTLALMDLAAPAASPGIGRDRATDIVASGLLPFALALAAQTDDDALAEAAARCWEVLPAGGDNAVTRRANIQVAGGRNLGPLGARGTQGLIHLDAQYCAPRRCYECPVAHAVVRSEVDQRPGERTNTPLLGRRLGGGSS